MNLKIIVLIAIAQFVFAAPAFSGKRTFVQPDGTEVNYRLKGDEYLHWIETQQGDILLYNEAKNRFEYAEIKDGNLRQSGVLFAPKHHQKRASKKNTFHSVSKEELTSLQQQKRQRRHRLEQK